MAIVLFTDYGHDLYAGQVKAVLLEQAPRVPIIDLLHDAPAFNMRASAHLLAACLSRFALRTVFLTVVDPGVGTTRDAVVADCDGRYLVGPDNGLLSVCTARAQVKRCWSITWRPPSSSASFHGRDLFAPVAGMIAAGQWPAERIAEKRRLDVEFGAADAAEVIYIDHYGNACTGLQARRVSTEATVIAGERTVRHARVFGEVAQGEPFWYENSLGLVEIAVSRGSAAALLGLTVGQAVHVG